MTLLAGQSCMHSATYVCLLWTFKTGLNYRTNQLHLYPSIHACMHTHAHAVSIKEQKERKLLHGCQI